MTTYRPVTLEIAGERLSLRTDRDEAFLQELAAYVSSQIETLRGSARNVAIQHVYLLVALKLADELYDERERSAALMSELADRSKRMIDMVDRELRASQPSSSSS